MTVLTDLKVKYWIVSGINKIAQREVTVAGEELEALLEETAPEDMTKEITELVEANIQSDFDEHVQFSYKQENLNSLAEGYIKRNARDIAYEPQYMV